MNFKQLREADLSKAQIKKVHDKADEMPKSDFIKRYGKDGDSVRFATATNMVKKQLNIEALDKEDEKSIGDVVKGLKKAVKSHQAQVKSLTKDIQDEVELTEKKANYIDIKLNSTNDLKRMMVWLDKNISPVNNELYDNAAQEGQSIIQFEDVPNVDKLMQKLKSARINFKVDTMEGGPGSGPQHGEITITKNGKSKKVKRPALSIFKKAGWKQESVELGEVHFPNRGEPPAPKGMHKLRSGRDIPSSPQVDKIHKKVVAMTDRNDHFGAKIEIAKECGDKQLVQIYNALELMHDKYGVVGNKSIELRQIFEPVLNNAIDRKFGKYADVIRDAT